MIHKGIIILLLINIILASSKLSAQENMDKPDTLGTMAYGYSTYYYMTKIKHSFEILNFSVQKRKILKYDPNLSYSYPKEIENDFQLLKDSLKAEITRIGTPIFSKYDTLITKDSLTGEKIENITKNTPKYFEIEDTFISKLANKKAIIYFVYSDPHWRNPYGLTIPEDYKVDKRAAIVFKTLAEKYHDQIVFKACPANLNYGKKNIGMNRFRIKFAPQILLASVDIVQDEKFGYNNPDIRIIDQVLLNIKTDEQVEVAVQELSDYIETNITNRNGKYALRGNGKNIFENGKSTLDKMKYGSPYEISVDVHELRGLQGQKNPDDVLALEFREGLYEEISKEGNAKTTDFAEKVLKSETPCLVFFYDALDESMFSQAKDMAIIFKEVMKFYTATYGNNIKFYVFHVNEGAKYRFGKDLGIEVSPETQKVPSIGLYCKNDFLAGLSSKTVIRVDMYNLDNKLKSPPIDETINEMIYKWIPSNLQTHRNVIYRYEHYNVLKTWEIENE